MNRSVRRSVVISSDQWALWSPLFYRWVSSEYTTHFLHAHHSKVIGLKIVTWIPSPMVLRNIRAAFRFRNAVLKPGVLCNAAHGFPQLLIYRKA